MMTMSETPRTRVAVRAALAAGAMLIGLSTAGNAADQFSDSKTIRVEGKVEARCTVSVSDTYAADPTSALSQALTNGSSASPVPVGNIEQNCNKKQGYTLTVVSNNCVTAGTGTPVLKTDTATNSDTQPYSLTLVTGTTTETTVPTDAGCGQKVDIADKQSGRVTSVNISLTPLSQPVAADLYYDVLNVSLVAKN